MSEHARSEQNVGKAKGAQRQHDAGVPGFYVFDQAAQVIVAGPYKVLGTAEYQAALREPPSMGVTEVCSS